MNTIITKRGIDYSVTTTGDYAACDRADCDWHYKGHNALIVGEMHLRSHMAVAP